MPFSRGRHEEGLPISYLFTDKESEAPYTELLWGELPVQVWGLIKRWVDDLDICRRLDICHRRLVAWCVWQFWDPMDCSPPGPSVHGDSQARILEWVAISFSRRSSQPRDWTCASYILYHWATRQVPSQKMRGPKIPGGSFLWAWYFMG